MSDDDYSVNSESDNSIEEVELKRSNKNISKITKPSSKTIESYGDDSEEEEEEPEEDEDDDYETQKGGVDDLEYNSEDEYEEKKEVEVDEDEDENIAEQEDEDEDLELNEEGEPIQKVTNTKQAKNVKTKKTIPLIIEHDDDDDDEYDENYLQKFDAEVTKSYINEFHPECLIHNYDEISKMCVVVRNSDGIIIDPNHRTIPYLTKYEKARVLGQRAKQIETGSKPLVKVPENIVDSYIIAELELKEKKIPFIIRRPIPSGGSEYWYLRDLENIGF